MIFLVPCQICHFCSPLVLRGKYQLERPMRSAVSTKIPGRPAGYARLPERLFATWSCELVPLESGRLSRDSVFRFDGYPVMSARVGIAVGSLLQELSLLVAGTSDSVARNTALALRIF